MKGSPKPYFLANISSVYFVNLEDDITLTLAKRAQNVEQMVFVQQLATAKARQIMAVQRNRMLN